MVKSLARTFGQDLMRGEHVVGGDKTNGGVLMPSHTSGDPSFYAKKRAKEAELGHGLRGPGRVIFWNVAPLPKP